MAFIHLEDQVLVFLKDLSFTKDDCGEVSCAKYLFGELWFKDTLLFIMIALFHSTINKRRCWRNV